MTIALISAINPRTAQTASAIPAPTIWNRSTLRWIAHFVPNYTGKIGIVLPSEQALVAGASAHVRGGTGRQSRRQDSSERRKAIIILFLVLGHFGIEVNCDFGCRLISDVTRNPMDRMVNRCQAGQYETTQNSCDQVLCAYPVECLHQHTVPKEFL